MTRERLTKGDFDRLESGYPKILARLKIIRVTHGKAGSIAGWRTGVHRFVVVFIPPRNKEEKVRKYLTEWCKNPIIKLVKSGKLSQAAVPIEKKQK